MERKKRFETKDEMLALVQAPLLFLSIHFFAFIVCL
ncbi:hypothetical protein BBR47_26090 [Brevibacillus brevis NBRC 100599]|uniref:Uncharacterized protein n=1 Tax=Brevibacillus brevis (strain 47 / JCM 6285 / NBRC 100599) TaxID=358681 RepID=C0ZCS7_BREBN|nr:hypothetical protein BBR47_26090 [Brevibacillus brevis NBRC 100599]